MYTLNISFVVLTRRYILNISFVVLTRMYTLNILLKGVQEKIETPITEEILDSQQNSNNTLDSNVTPQITLPYTGKEVHKIIQVLRDF